MKAFIINTLLTFSIMLLVYSCTDHSNDKISTIDLSGSTSEMGALRSSDKMETLTERWLNFESMSYESGFDITKNLTPRSELIYQKAISTAMKQLSSIKFPLEQVAGDNPRTISTYEIYPTGNYPEDRIYVQTLINVLGKVGLDAKVILKLKNKAGVPTAFNFGFSTGDVSSNGGWVLISADQGSGSIEFVGESNGNEMTTISGGYRFPNYQGGSFFIVDRINDDFSFKNIRFTNEGGIEPSRVGSFAVKDCKFDNTTIGIDNFGRGGPVTIKNNTFDGVTVPMRMFNHNPTVEIKGNLMNSAGEALIFSKLTGSYTIKNNTISTTDFNDPTIFGNGILLFPLESASFVISDNRISCNHPFASGIAIFDILGNVRDVFIKDNDINMNSDFYSAIDILGYGNSISDICISKNDVSGSAASAFYIASVPELGSPTSNISDISVIDNDIQNYETTCLARVEYGSALGCVDLFLDATTHDLTFCGKADIVIDKGVNNSFLNDNCPKCE